MSRGGAIDLDRLPPGAAGTYALLMRSDTRRRVAVGRRGEMRLQPGWYLYVGSAFGPGGLAGRLAHHLGLARRPRWHLDYLRPAVSPRELWYTTEPIAREHDWAQLLAARPGAVMPLPRFGATDCRCPAHLFFFRRRPDAAHFRRRLRRRHPCHGPLLRLAQTAAGRGRRKPKETP